MLFVLIVAGCAHPATGPAAPGTAPAGPTGDSGITGRTTVDAGCPVERDATPCPDRPVSAVITVTRTGSSAAVATVTSGTDGTFRVALPPGGYTLRPANRTGSLLPAAQPVDVTVHAGRYTEVTISFDSGIRGAAPPGAPPG